MPDASRFDIVKRVAGDRARLAEFKVEFVEHPGFFVHDTGAVVPAVRMVCVGALDAAKYFRWYDTLRGITAELDREHPGLLNPEFTKVENDTEGEELRYGMVYAVNG